MVINKFIIDSWNGKIEIIKNDPVYYNYTNVTYSIIFQQRQSPIMNEKQTILTLIDMKVGKNQLKQIFDDQVVESLFPINSSVDPESINEYINQSINESINQPINESINQPDSKEPSDSKKPSNSESTKTGFFGRIFNFRDKK